MCVWLVKFETLKYSVSPMFLKQTLQRGSSGVLVTAGALPVDDEVAVAALVIVGSSPDSTLSRFLSKLLKNAKPF